MTVQEAIKIIKNERESMRRLVDDCDLPITGGHKYIEAYDMAISALEKQIPKKPSEGNVHIVYLCPNCGSIDYTIPYCKHCGQHLSFKEVYE